MKSRNILLTAVALPLLWGCARHLEPSFTKCEKVTITASLDGEDSSKVAITQGDSKLSLSWQGKDTLRVTGTTSEKFCIDEGFTAHSASFTGNKVEGESFTVMYPGTYASEEAIMARTYLNQVQHGNGSTAHLEFNAIARGLENYRNVNFSKSDSRVMVNGAIKFVVKLPQDVTKVASITMQAGSDVFYSTNNTTGRSNAITLFFEECDITATDHILTAYIMTSWQPLSLMRGSELTIRVAVEGRACYYENVITTNKTYKFLGGECFVMDMSSKPMVHKVSGEGTKDNPYTISDPEDFRLVSTLAKSNSTTYFILGNDIDMAGEAFVPLFTKSAHTCNIDFAGGGHIIRNINIEASDCPSIFGELNGTVSEMVIENPVITGTSGDCGVICGRLGSATTTGKIKKVKIVNPTVNATLNGSSYGAGVFVGNALGGSIESVTVKYGSVTAGGSSTYAAVGGVVGNTRGVAVNNVEADTLAVCNKLTNTQTSYDKASATGGIAGRVSFPTSVANCSFTGGTVSADVANFVGGILGMSTVLADVINCRAEFDLTASTNVGGVIGYLYAGSASKCFYKGALTSKGRQVGGIVGYAGANATISDCCSDGTIKTTDQAIGGIAGEMMSGSTITSCYSTAKIVGGRAAGGIAGRMSNGTWTASGKSYDNRVNYSIAWNSSLSATGDSSQGGSGAFIGFTGTKNSFDYCYRKYNFSFSCSACPSGVTPLVNHDRSTSDITDGISSPYWYPYHAHDVSSTEYPNVSSVAKYINTRITGAWNTKVWNLDKDYPELIANGGQGGAGGDTPEPTPGINPGDEWTKTSVADGVDYYLFHKRDAISGQMQCVHVTAVDLTSGKWALKLFFDRGGHINSEIFKSTGAVASINASYEQSSIVIKKDGKLYCNITNNEIMSTGVPNWKNEGAICFNKGLLGDISVNAAGFGKDLTYQRKVYKAMPEENIISSAPVLILNFEQLGTTFCSRYSGPQWGDDHETPASHQGASYPRTAIGYTYDGYLLLVVVDGRFSGQAVGMSAANLTKFMVKYFNPKDLINLDGGGSSTMCVKGCGDSKTHVVNHPCDDGNFDHTDERSVPTHFYIIENK